MKKWRVFYGDQLRTVVEAEKAFVTNDGRLSFFNTGARGNVAGFANGSWTYYVEAQEGVR